VAGKTVCPLRPEWYLLDQSDVFSNEGDMKPSGYLIAFCFATLMLIRGSSSKGQAPASEQSIPTEKVLALVRRVEEQQKVIESNEIKINTRLAEVSETVRQAWVFARRAQK
jgi:hypothetical protein